MCSLLMKEQFTIVSNSVGAQVDEPWLQTAGDDGWPKARLSYFVNMLRCDSAYGQSQLDINVFFFFIDKNLTCDSN